jgi:hypothetical protein
MTTVVARRDRIRAAIGDPKKVDKELRKFRRSSKVLSSDNPRLIDRYPKKWVAVYDGQVQAQAKTLPALMTALERLGLPKEDVIVRFIDKDDRKMIL